MSESHFSLGHIIELFRGHGSKQNQDSKPREGMMSSDIQLHPAIDRGLRAGRADFAGGTLVCKCQTDPVKVEIKGNLAHNHACGCSKCWKPAGAIFSVVAVVPRENLRVVANEKKLAGRRPVGHDPAARLQGLRRPYVRPHREQEPSLLWP